MSLVTTREKYIDGYYGAPQRISRTPLRYEFDGNGDSITAEYDATYIIDQIKYAKTALGTLDPEARSVAVSSANTSTDVITCAAAHGFVTGQCVHLLITSGLTGLTTAKAYFAIVVSSTTLKLATNSNNADVGTAIDITATGTGTLYEGFYLIDETNPDMFLTERGTFRRTYSNIPRQQIVPGSKYVTKPDLPGSFPQRSGDAIIVQPEEFVPRWVFYSRLAVTGDTGSPGSGGLPTAGAYTLTYGASTTSLLAYNASPVTVAAALNGLASIIASPGGSVAVTGSYSAGFVITFATIPYATVNTGSLTFASGTATYTPSSTPGLGQNWSQGFFIYSSLGTNVTGGTFTITIFGQTTSAIAYNATSAAVTSALNALSNVAAKGGVVELTSSANINSVPQIVQYAFRFAVQSAMTAGTTVLYPYGSTGTVTPNYSGMIQDLEFAGGTTALRVFTSASHGIVAGDDIVLLIGTSYFTVESGLFTVVDANNISITGLAGNAYTAGGTATFIGKAGATAYTGGGKEVRVNRITDFWFPGTTVGIATAADIPLSTYQGDNVSLLAAIFAGTNPTNIEVGQWEYYRKGPIIMRTLETLDASTL